ncbi:MAG: valine--tRNA ligase [Deltaproteobacteria bacterium]|nr:valine--tRNA ligase [Deltaproteobacteria bacterium]
MSDGSNKYNYRDSENRWATAWDEHKVYKWHEDRPREETFVVDTPPPTVSGSLHIGHVFSYTHTDITVRYQRMLGKNIMYPMGWDDNGLPTERRVENKLNIRCRPNLPYDNSWNIEKSQGTEKQPEGVSRLNFIEACDVVCKEDEAAFEDLWKRLGLSVEWEQTYATIDKNSIKCSQWSFLDLVEKGLVVNAEGPTLWDFRFQSAVSQAELEDRVTAGAFHDLRFAIEGGGEFVISTTRPELLAACIAVVAHPSDSRYQKYFGKYAITPVFGARVPIVAAEHADPEKGTGILMVCTFGDIYDVQWWKQSGMPMKQMINRLGLMQAITFGEEPFSSVDPQRAQAAYNQLTGKNLKAARKIMLDLLKEGGSGPHGEGVALKGDPKPLEHPVKFYEKGDDPVEYIATRQWFVDVLNHKANLIEQGQKINWYPAYMRSRYESWVEGLSHNWCISRQRYFGVPFPVWYRIDANGAIDYEHPIYADRQSLPIDPQSMPAPGYDESQRGQANGFCGDPDVMDTWATSSLTPQIVSKWTDDKGRHQKLFPMDLRPQAHEIIRTWAFYTIYKAWMHEGTIPWKNIAISGFIVDPDRKKMSKSKGNTVTPHGLLDKYSSDAVRYWAGRAHLGVDTIFDESIFKLGQKLVTKLFNAARFVEFQTQSFVDAHGSKPTLADINEQLDLALIESLRGTIKQATKELEEYEFAGALLAVESRFWHFCDHYVEIVKGRSYDTENVSGFRSAVATLSYAINVFVHMFAPYLPYICEDIWQSRSEAKGQAFSSIHTAAWPKLEELSVIPAPKDSNLLDLVIEVVEVVRATKSENQKTLKWPVETLEISGKEVDIDALQSALYDIKRVTRSSDEGIILSIGAPSENKNFEIKAQLAATFDEG